MVTLVVNLSWTALPFDVRLKHPVIDLSKEITCFVSPKYHSYVFVMGRPTYPEYTISV